MYCVCSYTVLCLIRRETLLIKIKELWRVKKKSLNILNIILKVC